ncbi:cyclin-dependent kinase inhibitor 1C-like [Anopheles cruzii]|uniref:cyclin-dependent kinase inhibitor 1C-like n=1 Tax=Anopheles cruzii TaxID=68878 RepID=UPI0022EC49C5|nr:cyclin-dependent kinase inhibitor 1C-like [Anopheles cruzii]
MKVLALMVLPLALVYAGSNTDVDSISLLDPKQQSEHQTTTLGTKKEKRGIFGLGAYTPGSPVYGHGFAHHAPHLLPPAEPLAPVAFAAPPLPDPFGPYLGAHAHTHTVITKKVGIPIPAPYAVPIHVPVAVDRPYPVAVPRPYAVPVDRPYPVPVDRPYPVAIPHPIPVPVVKHVGYPVPVSVPVHTPVVIEKPVVPAIGPDPWATARLW